jgi:hypothetical protein
MASQQWPDSQTGNGYVVEFKELHFAEEICMAELNAASRLLVRQTQP